MPFQALHNCVRRTGRHRLRATLILNKTSSQTVRPSMAIHHTLRPRPTQRYPHLRRPIVLQLVSRLCRKMTLWFSLTRGRFPLGSMKIRLEGLQLILNQYRQSAYLVLCPILHSHHLTARQNHPQIAIDEALAERIQAIMGHQRLKRQLTLKDFN